MAVIELDKVNRLAQYLNWTLAEMQREIGSKPPTRAPESCLLTPLRRRMSCYRCSALAGQQPAPLSRATNQARCIDRASGRENVAAGQRMSRALARSLKPCLIGVG